ncbi:hypothetical protein VTK56DRAFT_7149 [Thermocarpiscus australiensis]
MAPRLQPATRLTSCSLFATRIPLLRVPPLPSRVPLPSSLRRNDPVTAPGAAVPSTIRTSSTSWLLSALPNLTPHPSQPPPPKTLRARRTLPYPPAQIYALIADIDAYSNFLPHCTHSRVTSWTTAPSPPPPPSQGDKDKANKNDSNTPRRYPCQADLTVGWGPFTQTYTSRVYCVPGEVVEAVSGAAETSIPRDVLRRVGYDIPEPEGLGVGGGGGDGAASRHQKKTKTTTTEDGIFESLVTRWTVRPTAAAAAAVVGGSKKDAEEDSGGAARGKNWTEVTLSVTFRFANPALGFAVGQVADEMVDEMVKAFEARARELYGSRG